jgi:hypothetical protein
MASKSKYGKYFKMVDNIATCLQPNCKYVYSSKASSNPTTCLRNHLEQHHKEIFAQLKREEEAEKAKKKINEKQPTLKQMLSSSASSSSAFDGNADSQPPFKLPKFQQTPFSSSQPAINKSFS